jgi:myo-inositol-1(or 4)-monophosphatase
MSAASSPDWLGAARRAAAALRAMLAERTTVAERVIETGARGEGGDRTLETDALAEEAVLEQLAALHVAGARFTVISEERGTVDFGGDGTLVVVDPIDGSLNAKRGLPHHCVSIAVAEGPTMADVTFGFVQDFGPDEEWVAWRGGGATLNGAPLDPGVVERRWASDGKLELVGFESADPRWVLRSAEGLVQVAHRLRAIGTIAAALCQVAGGRFDGMVTLKDCRAVDAAAAQLVVREAGGLVAFPRFEDPLAAPLDVKPHSPVVAARSEAGLRELAAVPRL